METDIGTAPGLRASPLGAVTLPSTGDQPFVPRNTTSLLFHVRHLSTGARKVLEPGGAAVLSRQRRSLRFTPGCAETRPSEAAGHCPSNKSRATCLDRVTLGQGRPEHGQRNASRGVNALWGTGRAPASLARVPTVPTAQTLLVPVAGPPGLGPCVPSPRPNPSAGRPWTGGTDGPFLEQLALPRPQDPAHVGIFWRQGHSCLCPVALETCGRNRELPLGELRPV